jgi:hypothetical protein
MIEFYLSALGVTLTLLLIWFYSPFRTSIGRLFFSKSISSNEDFETALLYKSPFLGKLLGCFICSSFWCSLSIGTLFWLFFSLPNYFIPLCWFTFPSIAYLYKSIIDKNK